VTIYTLSERNRFVRDALIDVVVCVGGGRRTRLRLACGARVEEVDVAENDLRLVTLLTGLLVIPAAGFQFAVEVEQTALLHVVTDNLCGARERGNVVPLGLLDDVAAVVLILLGGCELEVRDENAAVGAAGLGGFRSVSDQCNAIESLCHCGISLLGSVGLRLWPCGRW